MSEAKFIWLGLQNDREKEIYLEAFWDGVAENFKIQAEMLKLEKEWKDGSIKTSIQSTTTTVQ